MNRDPNQITRSQLYDRSRYPNGGPRGDQNLCCLTFLCAANFAMCPLHWLATCGFDEAVDGLTSHAFWWWCRVGIPCSPCNPSAMMPLWFCSEPTGWAASHGQLHTVMVLVKNGADPKRKNCSDNNAFSDAKREKHQHVVDWLNEWQRIEGR
jgi:hypothetical protein